MLMISMGVAEPGWRGWAMSPTSWTINVAVDIVWERHSTIPNLNKYDIWGPCYYIWHMICDVQIWLKTLTHNLVQLHISNNMLILVWIHIRFWRHKRIQVATQWVTLTSWISRATCTNIILQWSIYVVVVARHLFFEESYDDIPNVVGCGTTYPYLLNHSLIMVHILASRYYPITHIWRLKQLIDW